MMYLKKYLFAIVSILVLTTSCTEELKNPTLSDADLKVYFEGVGGTVDGVAWTGYNVIVGESKTITLQVTPAQDTTVKWVDDATGEVLSETLAYTFTPTEVGLKRVNFIATRSTFEKIIKFNFRGVPDGYSSRINSWQSILIPQGTQTGEFIAEFDMIPSKDEMDGVVGILDGVANAYSDNSCIVRLNPSGKIDAFNVSGYSAENDFTYQANTTYHIKMEVNSVDMTYNVFATAPGGTPIVIASNYGFRRNVTHLNYWSMVAGDFNLTDPGTHQVLNMTITTLSQNQSPVFIPVDDIEILEGSHTAIEIESIDPLGGSLILEAVDLPRFATFSDNGFGHGVVELDPYADCGGCDLGVYDLHIKATNALETNDLHFAVTVVDPNSEFEIPIHADDATVWGNGASDNGYVNLFGGRVAAGVGGEDEVVAVMPFQLPDIPVGKEVASAQLKVVTTTNNSWVAVDYDIYAIAERGNATVLATDFFIGDYDTDPNATAIQQGYIQNGDAIGEVLMSDTSGTALADYINSRYANGASAGDFMFLRINADRAMPLWAHLQFKSANSDVSGAEPVLVVVYRDL